MYYCLKYKSLQQFFHVYKQNSSCHNNVLCWKLVCWSKHVCNALILPSRWGYIVQKQVIGGGWRGWDRDHSPYYKTLWHQNDSEAVIHCFIENSSGGVVISSGQKNRKKKNRTTNVFIVLKRAESLICESWLWIQIKQNITLATCLFQEMKSRCQHS